MTPQEPWLVGLTSAADADYDEILSWTAEHFGEAQALSYRETIDLAIHALASGPTTIGVRTREDIAPGIFTLRIARGHRRGRHLLIFRVGRREDENIIEVVRILHDSMDLARHLPSSSEENGAPAKGE